ncbi:hypothetical protein [Arthrobacter woluwensis]|uniref:hypothetical protein n=1 Tax=Arthrobacter woluwensis TaxID=156980 RepID=UPI001AAFE47E|nr:hypothetical protein [Arthrobacter woluwensis]QTF70597.1 hypothetical protein G8758_00150 [Arthrobacter woluwensis]
MAYKMRFAIGDVEVLIANSGAVYIEDAHANTTAVGDDPHEAGLKLRAALDALDAFKKIRNDNYGAFRKEEGHG